MTTKRQSLDKKRKYKKFFDKKTRQHLINEAWLKLLLEIPLQLALTPYIADELISRTLKTVKKMSSDPCKHSEVCPNKRIVEEMVIQDWIGMECVSFMPEVQKKTGQPLYLKL